MEDDPSLEQSDQQQAYAYAADARDVSGSPFPSEQDVYPGNQEPYEEEDYDAAEPDPVATRGLLSQLWQYVTLIVLPFLFFGLSCLLILPPIAVGSAYLPPLSFWFIAVVLICIAIGQGVAVYFAGPHHNMWVLGTFGGLVLFMLFGVFAVVGPLAGTLLLLAMLVCCIYLARRCIHPVLEGFVDIVYATGKYKRTLYAGGFNLIWPWEEVRNQVNIEETNWNCPPQKIQLSPEEDVILRAVISYQVVPEDAYLAVTQVNNWEESLRNLFVTTLQTISTHFAPTDFLAWPQSLQAYQSQATHNDSQSAHLPDEGVDDFTGGPARREHINTLLFQQMRDRVALWGIQIHWVRIRDIELAPHTLSAIGAPPIMPDYGANANDKQADKDLIATPNVVQSDAAQPANGQDKFNTERMIKHVPTDQEPTEVMQMAAFPTPNMPSPPPPNLPDEEILKKAYQEVQNGKVTDPQAIRQIATTFMAVARDPEANQRVSFDAERAAENLYEQAQRYEELYRANMAYSDAAKPDLHV
jgi:regulator of protease activity HflC (stomatin/prohibitin superfamily)